MTMRNGDDGKLYICAAGIGGTPVWTEVIGATDVSSPSAMKTVDAKTRGSAGMDMVRRVGTSLEITAKIPWDTASPGFAEILTAFTTGAVIGVMSLDGDKGLAGSQGPKFDGLVVKLDRAEPLGGLMMADVQFLPTPTANAPSWHTAP